MLEYEKPIDENIIETTLLGIPSQRVGYSDRTAWLMATMSQLAYFQFENTSSMEGIAEDLAAMSGTEETLNFLQSVLAGLDLGGNTNFEGTLREILKVANFELLKIFDVGSTQAFLARRITDDDREKMQVLAFRGTEKKLTDWKVDIKAKLVPARDANKGGRIHEGFQDAYYSVESQIETELKRHAKEPLYITGHSLGGALAVIATRFLNAESLAACYTFGAPRVGDLKLSYVFKTPIYRLVNSADAVPRLPFGYGQFIGLRVLGWILNIIPEFRILNRLYNYLEMMTGYTHYGDSRYLTVAEPGASDTYPDLQLISNPGFFLVMPRIWKRVIKTKAKALMQDHSIGIYRAKLRARAISRN